MALLGAYVGNSTSALNRYESFMGREADLVHVFVGRKSWYDFTASPSWQVNQLFDDRAGDLMWSVPLTLDSGTSLASAGRGSYDQYYRSVAQTIASGTPGSDAIYIRPGWELNGSWFPWSATQSPSDYIAAFRTFVDEFRSVSNRFRFEWNVNEANGGLNPASAYPGDSYVDVVGMDYYLVPQYKGSDPIAAFNTFKTQRYGLDWLADFAEDHGKRIAMPEWGSTSSNAGPFIERMERWFEDNDVLYQAWWDSTEDYNARVSTGALGNTSTAYRNAFDDPSSGPTTPPPSSGGSGGQAPYGGRATWIGAGPVTLDATRFDTGGQGVAYYDTTSADLGGSAGRNTTVDIKGNNEAVIWIRDGEWLEYTINVQRSGWHAIDFSVASNNGGASIATTFARNGSVYEWSGSARVPRTDGVQDFDWTGRVYADLDAGVQVMRITFDDGGRFDLEALRIDAQWG